MRVRPPVPPRPVQRERVDDRPGARVEVEAVERPQHRLRVRPDRRSVRLAAGGADRHCCQRPRPPVRTGLLPRDLQPPAEITGLGPRRPVPVHPDRPAEPEPPQQVGPVRTDGGLRLPRRQQVPEELGCTVHHDAVRVDDLIGLVPVPRGHETACLRHPQRRQVPVRISFFDHDRRTYRQEQLFTR